MAKEIALRTAIAGKTLAEKEEERQSGRINEQRERESGFDRLAVVAQQFVERARVIYSAPDIRLPDDRNEYFRPMTFSPPDSVSIASVRYWPKAGNASLHVGIVATSETVNPMKEDSAIACMAIFADGSAFRMKRPPNFAAGELYLKTVSFPLDGNRYPLIKGIDQDPSISGDWGDWLKYGVVATMKSGERVQFYVRRIDPYSHFTSIMDLIGNLNGTLKRNKILVTGAYVLNAAEDV